MIRARWILCSLLLALLWWATPPDEPAFRACPFFWITGHPCPLCGLTRGLCALLKGHWSQAIHFNLLTPLALVLLLSLLWKFPWRARLWQCSLALFAVYGVIRFA